VDRERRVIFKTATGRLRDPACENCEEDRPMTYRTVISIIVASMLVLTSMLSYADQGKGAGKAGKPDQQMDHDRYKDKDHDKDQTHDRDKDNDKDRDQDIYGEELMSPEERSQYREQMRRMESEEERLKFQAQHREKMDARAKALALEIEEAE
jgi:Ni/Co efflux regulator RcnB